MEHKDYKLEIINSLLTSNWHVRGLAKHLGINHMIVFRKFKELYEENVLDYKEEGKNKTYFLKNSVEAQTYIFIAENYKLIKLLKRKSFFRRIIELIQKDNRISLAIVFGSYAKGLENKNSDIDIYIETNNSKIKKDIENINSKINVKIGIYNKNNLLIQEIKKNHVIIKGIEVFYEKFFEEVK